MINLRELYDFHFLNIVKIICIWGCFIFLFSFHAFFIVHKVLLYLTRSLTL